jgi:ABC-type multidrug transport system ATPase subunit
MGLNPIYLDFVTFQFDLQTPQLTIRETMDFSARLRLDENDPAVNAESRKKFVDQTLSMLELTNIQDLQARELE